mmetsp:Transcript_8598/g.18276  ORF Transcript_8598/g.18276 Transcript_8598/m.18276 type:complete len:163 (-) Transcript_8598:1100-1588(-)|eukprot:CAMPEP_0202906172 /NCGR_PEP_ID=MMETSP1392-20130828/37636_1 /ASSEMBLY_ACC=CAM_ASM_000868 /TAXON_ID=225041 /ORGANISM="Chlamydomonas chlamydogama, Strain SAG 11-48b" /LENGTH=162 /DNA_ID=CAMNT_0049594551 /DNA_START=53 /DNA_END=541 /DNA_ORIENTATION=+
MAKWGEGDPRWVVEHRNDGKNVNSWHWEETSKLEWTKQRLSELLPGLSADLPAEKGSVTVTKVKDVAGDACITTRKGNRKLPLFDLRITLEVEGQLAGYDSKVTGEYKLEEFCSGGDDDDIIFTATVTGTGTHQDEVKRVIEGMRGRVLDRLRTFLTDFQAL